MIELPFLGPPRADQDTWSCAYMPVRGGTQHCDAPAEHHGFIFDLVNDRVVMLAEALSCDEHAPVMRLSTQLDHPLSSVCGLPGSECWWDHGRSGCRMRWDVNALTAQQSVTVGGTP